MRSIYFMKKALNPKYSSEERAEAFNQVYYRYIYENGGDSGWDEVLIKLRKACSKELTDAQKKRFGLDKANIKRSYLELKKIQKREKSAFPADIFYQHALSLIPKITRGNEKILEIGFGDYPILIDMLNNRGYFAFGLEPYPKKFDKKRTFKGTLKKLPFALDQEFDLVLINLVYTINYTYYYPKRFEWEMNNKTILLEKIASLIKTRGYLVLVDDIGTIFSRKTLEKYFRIILFEKDIFATDFDNNKIHGFGKITLLRKK